MHLTAFSLKLSIIINWIVLSSIFLSTSSSLAIKLYCWILIFFEIFVWVIIIFTILRWRVLLISKPCPYSLSAVMNKFLKVSRMKKIVAQLRDFESKVQDLKLNVCSASRRNSGPLLWHGISTFFFQFSGPDLIWICNTADCLRLKKSRKRFFFKSEDRGILSRVVPGA